MRSRVNGSGLVDKVIDLGRRDDIKKMGSILTAKHAGCKSFIWIN